MDKKIKISSVESPDLTLYSIRSSDLDRLRIWKNEHREVFFHKEIISYSDQEKWFRDYLSRPNDFMFTIFVREIPIGCMGFRYIDKVIDVYNVILGNTQMGKKSYMSQALQIMCSYARQYYTCEQTARVLITNPAILWYKKNNFNIKTVYNDHYILELDENNFKFKIINEVVEEANL